MAGLDSVSFDISEFGFKPRSGYLFLGAVFLLSKYSLKQETQQLIALTALDQFAERLVFFDVEKQVQQVDFQLSAGPLLTQQPKKMVQDLRVAQDRLF